MNSVKNSRFEKCWHTLQIIFFSDFPYVLKLTTVHVNQSIHQMFSLSKKRCSSCFQLCQKSKGYFSELTELLQGVKIVRSKIKKKRKKRGYLSGSSLPGPIRQEPV